MARNAHRWPVETGFSISFAPIANVRSVHDIAGMGTVERAYQLAPSCRTIDELKARLAREGHMNIDAHFQGSLRTALKKLLASG